MMWPTEYAELKRIDELLICGICYEYMDTSMTTSCSHNYCSLCIRKYLHYKTQCPTCSEETFEKDLRKNKILDDIIVYYLNFKEKFGKEPYREDIKTTKDKDLATACSLNDSECKEEIDIYDANQILQANSDNVENETNVSTPHGRKNYQQDISSPSTSASSKVASIFTPKSKKSFRHEKDCNAVVCPVCKVHVPQNNINKHLDDCLKREDTKHQPKKIESERKPLPKLVLNLMKDNVIRKRLKDLGLTSQGDRKALENRLQRYIILYNAECDKVNPRSISELIKQCEEEENLEKKAQKSSNRLNINRNTEHNIIEEQRKRYLSANKDSFNQLIKKIKDGPRKPFVRREILKKEKFEVPHKNHIVEDDSTIRDSETNDFLPIDSTNFYIDNSDSNSSFYPLQTYSSEVPTNFLAIELSSSSSDDTNQSVLTSNHDVLNLPCNSILSTPRVKTKNIKNELSSCKSTIHEEVAFSNLSSDTNVSKRESNILEDRMDIDNETSLSEQIKIESRNRREIKLVTRRNMDDAEYSQEKCVAHCASNDESDRNLCNETIDSIENIRCDIMDIDNIENQLDYDRSKEKESRNMTEECTSDHIKFEKENVKSDKNINFCVLRKRERDMTFALSDEEKIENKSTNGKKSARFGLSEARGFNNENIDENALQNEEKSPREIEQTRITRAKSIKSAAKRVIKLRSKTSNKTRNNNRN